MWCFLWYIKMMKKRLCIVFILICLLWMGCSETTPAESSEEISSVAEEVSEASQPEESSQILPHKPPVIIGIIDTGISTRAIPKENIREGRNYLDPSLSTEDTYGHGTAVASVILEIAPDAELVPLISNAYADGKIIQVENDVFAQIIRDAVDVYHCQIINISAGLILDKPSIREAIAYAEAQNVLVVASVGNDYEIMDAFKYYPAAYESVLAVGSMNCEQNEISTFSQRGNWVDVFAVGEEITIKTLSGNMRVSEGTSYAAAKVTAYASVLLQQFESELTVQELRQMVIESAETLEDGTKYIAE